MKPEDYNLRNSILGFRTGVVQNEGGEQAVMLLLHTNTGRIEAAMFDAPELIGLLDLLIEEVSHVGGEYMRHVLTHLGELETQLNRVAIGQRKATGQ